MSQDPADAKIPFPTPSGELVLMDGAQLARRKSELLDRLERRRRPKARPDVKARLLSQWKQTLALSSSAARKLVTDPTPASTPAPHRAPPRPPNPLRQPGRTAVKRVSRNTSARLPRPEPELEVLPLLEPVRLPTPEVDFALVPLTEAVSDPTPEPVHAPLPEVDFALVAEPEPAPEPAPEPEPELILEPEPEPAVAAAPEPPPPPRPAPHPAPYAPRPQTLREQLTEAAWQTAGMALVTVAVQVGKGLSLVDRLRRLIPYPL